MSKIIVQDNKLIVANENSFLYLNIGTTNHKFINLTNLTTEDGNKEKSKHPIDKDVKINFTCCALSYDGNLLAFQSAQKIVYVYNTQTWDIVYQKVLTRGASKILFTKDDKQLIIGDKTGDVYLYDLSSPDIKEKLLLGHLSMILDLLMTPDNKYLITCDRDEKIRVSHYPNCYNIEKYCLGHEEFVTSVALLPHDNRYLISSSGDGTIKLWNPLTELKNSNILCDFNLDKIINESKDHVQEKIADSEETEEQNVSKIKGFTSIQLNDNTSIICVTKFKCNIVYVLLIKDKTIQLLNEFHTKVEPVHLCLYNFEARSSDIVDKEESNGVVSANGLTLWILLSNNTLEIHTWNNIENKFIQTENEKLKDNLSVVNKVLGDNFVSDDKVEDNIIYVLQKRKMDEIGEYFARKNARLEEQSKKAKLSEIKV